MDFESGQDGYGQQDRVPVTRVRAARQAKACRSTFIECSDWAKSTMAACQAPKLRRHCAASRTTPLSKTNPPPLSSSAVLQLL